MNRARGAPPLVRTAFGHGAPAPAAVAATPTAAAMAPLSSFTALAGTQLNKSLLLNASALLFAGTHVLRVVTAHSVIPSVALIRDLAHPMSLVRSLGEFIVAVFPVLCYKLYTYRRRRIPPPRPTWAALALLEAPNVLAVAMYFVSAWFLSASITSGYSAYWALWTNDGRVNVRAIDLVTSLLVSATLYQSAATLVGTDTTPPFPLPQHRTYGHYLALTANVTANAIKSSVLFTAGFWMVGAWITPAMASIVSRVMLRGALEWTAWDYAGHWLSPVVVLGLFFVHWLAYLQWNMVALVCDLCATRNLAVTSTNQVLIEGLNLHDKPLLQHHAFQDLAMNVSTRSNRRVALFRDQPDRNTWTDVRTASLLMLDAITAGMLSAVAVPPPAAVAPVPAGASATAATPMVPGAVPVFKAPPNPKSVDPKEWVGKAWDWIKVQFLPQTIVQLLSTAPAATKAAPAISAKAAPTASLSTGPVAPFVWGTMPAASTASASAAATSTSAPTTTVQTVPAGAAFVVGARTSVTPGLAERLVRWIGTQFEQTTVAAYVRAAYTRIKLTMAVADYQAASWAALGVAQLVHFSKTEDPYGLVYPDIATVLSTLLHVVEVSTDLMAGTVRDGQDPVAVAAVAALAWPRAVVAASTRVLRRRVQVRIGGGNALGVSKDMAWPKVVLATPLAEWRSRAAVDTPVARVLAVYEACVAAVLVIVGTFPEYVRAEVVPRLSKRHAELVREIVGDSE
ncbi:hypothetical protein AMAG_17394 [Allomyces macrogynus ATCC 38327]|uniref:Nucleoporin protein Ndc1-Nup n=1 Tax=Allomyces macrogynus (strain ATCC 38327) TaxID=578462 RepID=A0A0L0TEX3_ALLM3|nr:hypothetical protein AMAG_17394 [Allomyces macrogynus ATCC 38327]|eukprot:KNE73206.1 hypothetical protein AMAG_17394 [Allomyces macrogynus ATCC 38327]